MTGFEVGKRYYTLDGGKCTVISRSSCYVKVKFYKNPEHANYFDRTFRLRVKSLDGVEYTPVINGLQADQIVEDLQ